MSNKYKNLPNIALVLFILVFSGIGSYLLFFSQAASNPIGDSNGDGSVNVFDLSILLGHWDQPGTSTTGDLNHDNTVSIFDLSILLEHWGDTRVITNSKITGGVSVGAGEETWFLSLDPAQQQTWINTMKSDQVSWLRVDVPGNLAGWYDSEISDAESAGINVDAIVETWGMSTVDPSAMSTMCTQQVAHYKPMGVETYEVINEPNKANRYTAAAYTPLLQACYTAIKAADSKATVLFGGLTAAAAPNSPATYLQAAYAAGAKGYFDAMNMHPYDFDSSMDQSPTTPANCPRNAWNPWVVCPYNETNGQQSEIYAVRQAMNNNGDRSKAIWLTEFGCPTGTDGDHPAACNDAMLAAQIAAAYSQANSNPNDQYGLLGPLLIYNWIDTNSSNNPNGSGYDDFGLYQVNGTPKTQSLNAYINAQ